MRVATWNVNSVKQRLPRLLPWLDQRQPDVVCLQETKVTDDAFGALLGDALAERGYEVAVAGEPGWNGVAILSKVGLVDVVLAAIYYADDEQKAAAEASQVAFQKRLSDAGYGAITTTIEPAGPFYYAEGYHQQYLSKNPYGYCPDNGNGVSCPVGLFGSGHQDPTGA